MVALKALVEVFFLQRKIAPKVFLASFTSSRMLSGLPGTDVTIL
jgi:hypothetical protein